MPATSLPRSGRTPPRKSASLLRTDSAFPHFELVWNQADEEADQELLLELQRRVVTELVDDLAGNIRKQGHEFEGGPSEQESNSWQRAIWLTTGWSKEALRDPRPDPKHRYQLPDYARVRPQDQDARTHGP